MIANTLCDRSQWINRSYMDYLIEVDWLLQDRYGITTDDTDLDMVAAAQEAGATPQDHVDWMAKYYDLQPLPQ